MTTLKSICCQHLPSNFQELLRILRRSSEVRNYAFSGTSPGKSGPCGAVVTPLQPSCCAHRQQIVDQKSLSGYAFSGTSPGKSGPCGAVVTPLQPSCCAHRQQIVDQKSLSGYAFSGTSPGKSGPCGAVVLIDCLRSFFGYFSWLLPIP